MNPQQPNIITSMNRVVFGILLLLIIIGSGFYGSLKFREIYDILATPTQQAPLVTPIDNNEKTNLLASVAVNVVDIEESERLSMLRKLSIQGSMDIASRNAVLNSLR